VPEVLNHKPKGVTSIYNRYKFDKEKQGALTAWAQELDRIVSVQDSTATEHGNALEGDPSRLIA
jgi:hypothetical protein